MEVRLSVSRSKLSIMASLNMPRVASAYLGQHFTCVRLHNIVKVKIVGVAPMVLSFKIWVCINMLWCYAYTPD